ncbi:hypothetical protein, partial [Salmonella enterica]
MPEVKTEKPHLLDMGKPQLRTERSPH